MMFDAAGPDTDILITSDHGFGPTTEIFYVNEWLSRNGYLQWSDDAKMTPSASSPRTSSKTISA